MSATDELRRLLDERGVEWWDGKSYGAKAVTFFTVRGVRLRYVDYWDYCWLDYHEDAPLTPEQAIAATLGAGTCRMEPVKDYPVGECAIYSFGCVCSECGSFFEYTSGRNWHYCPNCGAKVVSE